MALVPGEENRDALIRRLLLAQPANSDENESDRARVRRTLETGMVVTYARPFTKSGLQRLKRPSGLGAEQRALHQQMLDFRDVVYAHTDDTPLREVVETRDRETLERWLRDPSS